MIYRVTFYLPYPPSTVTRHTHTTTNLADARDLAARLYIAHRKHGPVTILNDMGDVVMTGYMIEELVDDIDMVPYEVRHVDPLDTP